jgi:anaerobic selenocysteine-containing dehydrogenase
MVSEERRTTCNRDCPDACGIVATVEDGVVTALRGDADHPVTRGFLCFRTSRFPEAQRARTRVTKPLLRRGGRLVEVPLAEALDVAAERLLRIRAESGGAAIFHYRSGGSLGLLKLVADRFFERFGPCATKIGDICSGAGEAAQILDFGVSDSNDLFDLENSRHIYLWGKNPFVSNVHLIPVLHRAKERGARVVLIDPVHHRGVGLADRALAPRPGSDAAIALGVARLLLDSGRHDPRAESFCDGFPAFAALARRKAVLDWAAEADVPVRALEEIADDFADGPTAILVGWGMQRRAGGAACVRALDALSAISGNLFRSGGGCSFYFRRRGAFASDAVAQGPGVAPRHIREPLFAADVKAAQDPKIRAIWVTAGNPVAMLPDSAAVAEIFERTEFTVVVDPFLTDTGRRASLVLPVPTLLEDSDLLGAYGHHWLAESRPVVPPPAGVLHEVELFQELARRTGLAAAMAGSIDEWKQRLLAKVDGRGASLADLRRGPQRNPLAPRLCFPEGRVHTPNGRVQLLGELPPPAPAAPPGHPLWLFSNSTEKSQASQWSGKGLGEHTWIAVHPSVTPGRAPGELVTVESARGALTAELRHDPHLRPDVAVMPKGGHFDRGHSANALIEATLTDEGLGAAYLDCRVRIR